MAESETYSDGVLTNLTPRHGLSDEDLEFCHILIFSPQTPVSRAYLEAYGPPPEHIKSGPAQLGAEKKKTVKIQRYLAWCNADPMVMAQDILREQMVMGSPTERRLAAKELRAQAEERAKVDPVADYFRVMRGCGADIVAPVLEGQREVRVSLGQILSGEAWMHLPPKALVELLHRAGAPWNEHNPKAKLSKMQQEILHRMERTRIVHGGSGVGKSVLGGSMALGTLCLPGTKTAIIGQTYDLASSEFQYVYEGFLKLFGAGAATRCIYKNNRTHKEMEIETIWGSWVVAFSLEYGAGAQMYGKEFDRVILAEASRMSSDVYYRAIVRALNRRLKEINLCPDECADREDPGGPCRNRGHRYSRNTGYCDMFTTPMGYDGPSADVVEHVMRLTERHPERLHFGNAPFADTIYIREASCLENPDYSREAFESAERNLPRDVFEEQYRGLMVRRSGLIFKEFNQDRHVRDRPSWDEIARMRLGVAMDTGKHFAALIGGICPDRTKWVLGEVYTQEWTTRANLIEVMRMVNGIVGQAWKLAPERWRVDNEGPEAEELVITHFRKLQEAIDIWRYDPASQIYQDMAEMLDVPLLADSFHNEKLGSINRVRTMFERDQLFIARDPEDEAPCAENFIWELSRYRWKLVIEKRGSNAAQLEPEKKDDHLCDTARYLFCPLDDFGGYLDERPAPRTFEENWQAQYVEPVLSWKKHQEALVGHGGKIPGVGGAYRRMFH